MIDGITEERELLIRNRMTLPEKIIDSLKTWPSFVCGLVEATDREIICAACGETSNVSRVVLYGQKYNSITLAPIQLDSRTSIQKVSGPFNSKYFYTNI